MNNNFTRFKLPFSCNSSHHYFMQLFSTVCLVLSTVALKCAQHCWNPTMYGACHWKRVHFWTDLLKKGTAQKAYIFFRSTRQEMKTLYVALDRSNMLLSLLPFASYMCDQHIHIITCRTTGKPVHTNCFKKKKQCYLAKSYQQRA